MGIIATDSQITPTSNAKGNQSKTFYISRTDTAATTKAILPSNASVLNVFIHNTGSTASNAATTATVTVQAYDGSNTNALRSAVDVKTAAAPPASGLINTNAAAFTSGRDIQIQGVYAETGTASTAGGPWQVTVVYTT